jgi:hypothetical protein
MFLVVEAITTPNAYYKQNTIFLALITPNYLKFGDKILIEPLALELKSKPLS